MENQMSFPHTQICMQLLTAHTLTALYGALQYSEHVESYYFKKGEKPTEGS